VVLGREFGREVVEHVRGVAEAREQDHRSSASTPIEHLETDVLLDVDELH